MTPRKKKRSKIEKHYDDPPVAKVVKLSTAVSSAPSLHDKCVDMPSVGFNLQHTAKTAMHEKIMTSVQKHNGSLSYDVTRDASLSAFDISKTKSISLGNSKDDISLVNSNSIPTSSIACSVSNQTCAMDCFNSEFQQPVKKLVHSCQNSTDPSCDTNEPQGDKTALLRRTKQQPPKQIMSSSLISLDLKTKAMTLHGSRSKPSKKQRIKRVCNEDDSTPVKNLTYKTLQSGLTSNLQVESHQPVDSMIMNFGYNITSISNSPATTDSTTSTDMIHNHILKPTVGISPSKKNRKSNQNSKTEIVECSDRVCDSLMKQQQTQPSGKESRTICSTTKNCNNRKKSPSAIKAKLPSELRRSTKALTVLALSSSDSEQVIPSHSESSTHSRNKAPSAKKGRSRKLSLPDNSQEISLTSDRQASHTIQPQKESVLLQCERENGNPLKSSSGLVGDSLASFKRHLDSASLDNKLESVGISSAEDEISTSACGKNKLCSNKASFRRKEIAPARKKKLDPAHKNSLISECFRQQLSVVGKCVNASMTPSNAAVGSKTLESATPSDCHSLNVGSNTFSVNSTDVNNEEFICNKDLTSELFTKETKSSSHAKKSGTKNNCVASFESGEAFSKDIKNCSHTSKHCNEQYPNTKIASHCLPSSTANMSCKRSELISEVDSNSQHESVVEPVPDNLNSTGSINRKVDKSSGSLLTSKSNESSSTKKSNKQSCYGKKRTSKSSIKHSHVKKRQKEQPSRLNKNTSKNTDALLDNVSSKLQKSLNATCSDDVLNNTNKSESVKTSLLPIICDETIDVTPVDSHDSSQSCSDLRRTSEVLSGRDSKMFISVESENEKKTLYKLNCSVDSNESLQLVNNNSQCSKQGITTSYSNPPPSACATKPWKEVDFLPPLCEAPPKKKAHKLKGGLTETSVNCKASPLVTVPQPRRLKPSEIIRNYNFINIPKSNKGQIQPSCTSSEPLKISSDANIVSELSTNVSNKSSHSEVSSHESLSNQTSSDKQATMPVVNNAGSKTKPTDQTAKTLISEPLQNCDSKNCLRTSAFITKDTKLQLKCVILLSRLKPSIIEEFCKLNSCSDKVKNDAFTLPLKDSTGEIELQTSHKICRKRSVSPNPLSTAKTNCCYEGKKKRKAPVLGFTSSEKRQKRRKNSPELTSDVIVSTIGMSPPSDDGLWMPSSSKWDASESLEQAVLQSVESSRLTDKRDVKSMKIKSSSVKTSIAFNGESRKSSSKSFAEKEGASSEQHACIDPFNKCISVKHVSRKISAGSTREESETNTVQDVGVLRIDIGNDLSKITLSNMPALEQKKLSKVSGVSKRSSHLVKKDACPGQDKSSDPSHTSKRVLSSMKENMSVKRSECQKKVSIDDELKKYSSTSFVNEASVNNEVDHLDCEHFDQSADRQRSQQEKDVRSLECSPAFSPTSDKSSDISFELDYQNSPAKDEHQMNLTLGKDSALLQSDSIVQDRLSTCAFDSCKNGSFSDVSVAFDNNIDTEISQRNHLESSLSTLEAHNPSTAGLLVDSGLSHLENCIVLDCVDDGITDLVPDTSPSIVKCANEPLKVHATQPMFSEIAADPFALDSTLRSMEPDLIPGLDLLQEDCSKLSTKDNCSALFDNTSGTSRSRVHFDIKILENVDKGLKLKAAMIGDVTDAISVQAHKSIPMEEASEDEQSDSEIWHNNPAVCNEENCQLEDAKSVLSDSVTTVNCSNEELQPLWSKDASEINNEPACEGMDLDIEMAEDQSDAISLLAPSLGHDSVLATSADAIEVTCPKKPVRKAIPLAYTEVEEDFGPQGVLPSDGSNQRRQQTPITFSNRLFALPQSDPVITRLQGEIHGNSIWCPNGLNSCEQMETDGSDGEEVGAHVENMNDMKTGELLNAFHQALRVDNLPNAVVLFESLVPKLMGTRRYEMLDDIFKKAQTRNSRMGKSLVRKVVKIVVKVISATSESLQKKVHLLRSCFKAIRHSISYPAHVELSSAISQGSSHSLTHLYNSILLNSINSDIVEVLHLYVAGKQLGIVLDTVVARALLIMFHLAHVPRVADELFKICCWMGIYPTLKVNEWPNCLRLKSYYTEAEISMLFNNYLQKLAVHFSRTSFFEGRVLTADEKYKSYLHIEVMEFPEGINVRFLRDVDFSFDAASCRIRNVLSGYGIRDLDLNNKHRILYIPSDEMQNALSSTVKYKQIAFHSKAPPWSHGPFKRAVFQNAVNWDANPFHN